ncbi:MAG: site-2 protease family protein [Firmicutes bacterium HGW-Firmicutes-13]|nr:MAG: site-2 protease family protein [Firmicutes bacterium HGW-Firmicutes-13]
MTGMNLGNLLIRIPALLIAITFHEYAHGRMANSLGDPTARFQGRLTLNPMAHLDPIGLLMLWLVGFGWAKPVPVNPLNFRGDKKKGMIMVSAAGPAMNLSLAFISIFFQHIFYFVFYNEILFVLLTSLGTYNILLAVFNLIPIPPLDGSKILAGLLPYRYDHYYRQLEQFGPILLLLLIVTRSFHVVLGPLFYYIQSFMMILISPIIRLFL